jgi:hypothetical protein
MGGLGLAVSTLAAAWVALGRRGLWLRLIALCLIPTSAVMAAWLALSRASGWLAAYEGQADPSGTAHPGKRATRSRYIRLARFGVVLLSLSIVLPPLVVFCVLVAPDPDVPKVVLPDPNGYHDLVKVGEVFGAAGVEDLDTATRQQLRGFVTRHGHAFHTARVGLARDCCMPPVYSTAQIGDSLDHVMALRDLALAFRAEGKLAELQGRPSDAAKSYLDAIQLGRETARGSRALHWTISHAFEGIGMDPLIGLRGKLTSEQCRELIDTLQTMNANREPVESVAARDQLFERIGFVWYEQLMETLSTITGSKRDLQSSLQEIAEQHEAKLRLLTCGLALRAYCAENGNPPEKLADLVPEYLTEVPRDPYSGKPLVYRRDAKGYVLYSVGSDGRDDGGQPGEPFEPDTDMLLDKPSEE